MFRGEKIMRRLLFIAYLLIVPCLSGSVHADTYEWGSVTNLDGKDYTIYITHYLYNILCLHQSELAIDRSRYRSD